MTHSTPHVESSKLTIDSHHHFFTKDSVKAFNRMIPPESYRDNSEFQEFLDELPTIEERVKSTVIEMEKSHVDQILLMSFSGDFDTVYRAHQLYPNQFPALIPFVDPRFDTVLKDLPK